MMMWIGPHLILFRINTNKQTKHYTIKFHIQIISHHLLKQKVRRTALMSGDSSLSCMTGSRITLCTFSYQCHCSSRLYELLTSRALTTIASVLHLFQVVSFHVNRLWMVHSLNQSMKCHITQQGIICQKFVCLLI